MSGSETTKRMIARINAEQREWNSRETVKADADNFDEQLLTDNDYDYAYVFEDIPFTEAQHMIADDDSQEPIDSRHSQERIDDDDSMPAKSGTGGDAVSRAGRGTGSETISGAESEDGIDDSDDLSVFDELRRESLDYDFDDVVMMGQHISSGVDVLGESNVIQHDGQSLSRHVRILLDEETGVEYLMFTDERGITVTPRYNADGTLRTGRIIDSGF